jgi:hypothetical protein
MEYKAGYFKAGYFKAGYFKAGYSKQKISKRKIWKRIWFQSTGISKQRQSWYKGKPTKTEVGGEAVKELLGKWIWPSEEARDLGLI